MADRRLRPVEPISEVLPPQGPRAVAGYVVRAHLPPADDPLAFLQHARRQLGVLVDLPFGAPAAESLEGRPAPHAGEHPAVEFDLVCVNKIEAVRSANAQPRAERVGDAHRPPPPPTRDLRTAHPA